MKLNIVDCIKFQIFFNWKWSRRSEIIDFKERKRKINDFEIRCFLFGQLMIFKIVVLLDF